MRQIFPLHDERPGPLLGPADPLSEVGRIRPPAASAEIERMVAVLGEVYAYPDRPCVRANFVASVDGAVTVEGRSGGLSGTADKLVFAVLRSLADVILVGAGTARTERYRKAQPAELWSQLRGDRPVPPVAVVTRRLDMDTDSPLFVGDGPRTIILTTEQADEQRRAAAARLADVDVLGAAAVTATDAVGALTARGFTRILVEGGPSMLGQLAAEGLLDEVCLTISPVFEGGQSPGRVAVSPVAGPGLTGLRLASVLEDGGALLTRYVRD